MSDDFKYRISTEGDVSGAKKVEEALSKVLEAAKKLDSKKLSGLVERAGEFVTVAAAVETAKKAIEEYANAEESVASLDAALAARAQLTDNYRVSLQKLAEAQQELTGIKGDEWLKVLTTLTQAGGNSGNIDTLVDATKNLAGILGGDLQSAAFAVGKALNGEFAAFTRLGLVFDDTAPQAKKLEQLWSQLAERGGGQLEARTETLKGAFRGLGNATGDLFKGVGSLFVSIVPVREVVVGLGEAVNWLGGIFGKTIPKADGLRNAVAQTGAAMESQEEIVRRYTKEYEALKNAAGAAANELDRALTAIKAKADQEKGVKNANTDALLKRVDEDEKTGRLTPMKAAERRAQIKKQADDENFKTETDARAKEIAALQAQAESVRRRVDEANKNAAAEKQKLQDMQELQHQRATIAFEGRAAVGTAQYLRDHGQATNQNVYEAEKKARLDLIGFDLEHGPLDLTTQAEKAKQAKEFAKKANADLYPQATTATARAIELQREQAAEMRKHGWVTEANREDAYLALKEARAKELGEVKHNADGSYEGTPAGVKHQRDIDKAVGGLQKYPENDPRNFTPAAKAALAARDKQIKDYKDVLDAMGKLTNIGFNGEMRKRAILDRIDVLEAMNRLNPNR